MDEEEKKEKIKESIKSVVVFLVITLISILIILIGSNKYKIENKEDIKYIKAKIVSVVITEKEDDAFVANDISFEAKRYNEENKKEETIFGRQIITETYPRKIVEEGDKVLLTKGETSEIYSFVDYNKTKSIVVLMIFFVLATILVGFWKGFNTIIALILNALIIFVVYIPSIVNGTNIYLSTILLSLYVVSSGLILLDGLNKKTFAAISGNIAGVLIAGLLALFLNKVFMITGYISDESAFLKLMSEGEKIDLIGIIWAGTVIGALGAIMDTAMSVASAIKEVSVNSEKKDFKVLFKSGMNVGRDAIGTMTNTLVLAYIGGALSTTILLIANSKDYIFLMNSEGIIVELLQAVVGSIGILLTVPLTVLIATYLEVKKDKNEKKFVQKYSEGLSFNFKKKK